MSVENEIKDIDIFILIFLIRMKTKRDSQGGEGGITALSWRHTYLGSNKHFVGKNPCSCQLEFPEGEGGEWKERDGSNNAISVRNKAKEAGDD